MKSALLPAATALLAGLGVGCEESTSPDPGPETSEAGAAGRAPSATEAPAEARADGARQRENLHAHMQEHFVRVDKMRLAIVEGDLEKAKSLAKWLATHPPHDDLPDGWEPYIEMMRSQASQVLEEQTLAEAALDSARVAGTCGSCHMANRAKVNLGVAHEPKDHQPLEHHMWAAERLWDAVVSQSDPLWAMGVAALRDAAVVPVDMKAPPERLKAAKAKFAGLVSKAAEAHTPNARVEALGTYLGQCQGCHAAAKSALDAF